jgi:hypothetical protein
MILLAFVGSNLRDTRALSKIANQDEAILRLVTEKSLLKDQLKATKASFHMVQVAMQTAIKEVEKKTIINKNLQIGLAQSEEALSREENLQLEKINISTELETAQNSINALENEIRKRKTKVLLLESRIEKLTNHLTNQRVEFGKKNTEIENLKKSIFQINLQFKAEKAARTLSDQVINTTNSILKERQTKLQTLKVENAKTIKRLNIETELLRKSNDQATQSDIEIEELQQRIAKLRKEKGQQVSSLNGELITLNGRNRALEKTQNTLQLQYDLSRKKINLLQKNKETLEKQLSNERRAKQAVLQSLKKAKSDVQAVLQELESKAQKKESESSVLLQELEIQKVNLQQKKKQLEKEILDQKLIISGLSEQMGLVTNQLQQTRHSLKSSQKTLLKKVDEFDKNVLATEKLQKKLAQSRSELTGLKSIKSENQDISRALKLVQANAVALKNTVTEQKNAERLLIEKIVSLNTEKNKQISILTEKVSQIEREMTVGSSMLDASIQDLKTAKRNKAKRDVEVEFIKKAKAEALLALTREQAVSRKAQDKLQKLQQKTGTLQNLLVRLEENNQQKIATLQEQLIKIKNQESFQSQHDAAQQELNLLNKNNKDLKLQLANAKMASQETLQNLKQAKIEIQATLLDLETARANEKNLEKVVQRNERLWADKVQVLERQNNQVDAENNQQKKKIIDQNQALSNLTAEKTALEKQLKKTENSLKITQNSLSVTLKTLKIKNSMVAKLQNSLNLRSKVLVDLTNATEGNLVSNRAAEGQSISGAARNIKNKATKEVRLLIEQVQSLTGKVNEKNSIIEEKNRRLENLEIYLSKSKQQVVEETSRVDATTQTLNETKQFLELKETELRSTVTHRDNLILKLTAEQQKTKTMADEKQELTQQINTLDIQIKETKKQSLQQITEIQGRLAQTEKDKQSLEQTQGTLQAKYDGSIRDIILLQENEKKINLQLANAKKTNKYIQKTLEKTRTEMLKTSKSLELSRTSNKEHELKARNSTRDWDEKFQALQAKFKATTVAVKNSNSLLKDARHSLSLEREAIRQSERLFLEFRKNTAGAIGASSNHSKAILSDLQRFIENNKKTSLKAKSLQKRLSDVNIQLNELQEIHETLQAKQSRSKLEMDLIDNILGNLNQKLAAETLAKNDVLQKLEQANIEAQKSLLGFEALRSISIERERLAQKNELEWKAERNELEAKVKELSAALVNLNTLLAEVQYSLSQEQEARRNAQQSFLEFRNKIASTISVPTNDPKELLSDLRLIHATQTNRKSQAIEIDAKLEVLEAENTLLEQQNSDLRLTVQTLLENTKKIIKQLRSTEP